MNYILIFVGGGLGSIARYGTGNLVDSWTRLSLPLGTLISNMLACVIMAVLLTFVIPKMDSNSWITPLLIIGFCGGYSTFSTFSNQTFELLNSGQYFWAITNIFVSVILGIFLIFFVRSRMM